MKRGHLMTGIVYVAVGILLLALSSLTEGRLGSLLFAFGFAGAVPGAVMIGKYVYWTSPRNRERYSERVDQERIDLQDELNQKLSDRSGRCAYLIGLAVLSVSIVAFSVLDALGVLNSRLLVGYLGAFMLLEVILGQVIFRRLRRKYEE